MLSTQTQKLPNGAYASPETEELFIFVQWLFHLNISNKTCLGTPTANVNAEAIKAAKEYFKELLQYVDDIHKLMAILDQYSNSQLMEHEKLNSWPPAFKTMLKRVDALTVQFQKMYFSTVKRFLAEGFNEYYNVSCHPHLTITEDHIFPTNGGAGGLHNIFKVFNDIDPNGYYITPFPRYILYSGFHNQNKLYPIDVMQEKGFRLTPALIDRTLKKAKTEGKKIKAFLICDPSNPMGTAITKDEWKEIIALFSKEENKHIYIIIDEAYVEMKFSKNNPSLLEFLSKNICTAEPEIQAMYEDIQRRTIILRSATKGLSAAGERMAAIIAFDKSICERLEIEINLSGKPPYSSQIAYAKAISNHNDPDFGEKYRFSRAYYDNQVKFVLKRLQDMGLHVDDPDYRNEGTFYALANLSKFIGYKIELSEMSKRLNKPVLRYLNENIGLNIEDGTLRTDKEIAYYLACAHDIAITPLSFFKGDPKAGYFRITCSAGTKVLKDFLSNLDKVRLQCNGTLPLPKPTASTFLSQEVQDQNEHIEVHTVSRKSSSQINKIEIDAQERKEHQELHSLSTRVQSAQELSERGENLSSTALRLEPIKLPHKRSSSTGSSLSPKSEPHFTLENQDLHQALALKRLDFNPNTHERRTILPLMYDKNFVQSLLIYWEMAEVKANRVATLWDTHKKQYMLRAKELKQYFHLLVETYLQTNLEKSQEQLRLDLAKLDLAKKALDDLLSFESDTPGDANILFPMHYLEIKASASEIIKLLLEKYPGIIDEKWEQFLKIYGYRNAESDATSNLNIFLKKCFSEVNDGMEKLLIRALKYAFNKKSNPSERPSTPTKAFKNFIETLSPEKNKILLFFLKAHLDAFQKSQINPAKNPELEILYSSPQEGAKEIITAILSDFITTVQIENQLLSSENSAEKDKTFISKLIYNWLSFATLKDYPLICARLIGFLLQKPGPNFIEEVVKLEAAIPYADPEGDLSDRAKAADALNLWYNKIDFIKPEHLLFFGCKAEYLLSRAFNNMLCFDEAGKLIGKEEENKPFAILFKRSLQKNPSFCINQIIDKLSCNPNGFIIVDESLAELTHSSREYSVSNFLLASKIKNQVILIRSASGVFTSDIERISLLMTFNPEIKTKLFEDSFNTHIHPPVSLQHAYAHALWIFTRDYKQTIKNQERLAKFYYVAESIDCTSKFKHRRLQACVDFLLARPPILRSCTEEDQPYPLPSPTERTTSPFSPTNALDVYHTWQLVYCSPTLQGLSVRGDVPTPFICSRLQDDTFSLAALEGGNPLPAQKRLSTKLSAPVVLERAESTPPTASPLLASAVLNQQTILPALRSANIKARTQSMACLSIAEFLTPEELTNPQDDLSPRPVISPDSGDGAHLAKALTPQTDSGEVTPVVTPYYSLCSSTSQSEASSAEGSPLLNSFNSRSGSAFQACLAKGNLEGASKFVPPKIVGSALPPTNNTHSSPPVLFAHARTATKGSEAPPSLPRVLEELSEPKQPISSP